LEITQLNIDGAPASIIFSGPSSPLINATLDNEGCVRFTDKEDNEFLKINETGISVGTNVINIVKGLDTEIVISVNGVP